MSRHTVLVSSITDGSRTRNIIAHLKQEVGKDLRPQLGSKLRHYTVNRHFPQKCGARGIRQYIGRFLVGLKWLSVSMPTRINISVIVDS